jgi:hypothetical protein
MIGEELLNLIRGPVLPPGTLGGAPNPTPNAGQPLPKPAAPPAQGGSSPNAPTPPQQPSAPPNAAPQSPQDLAQLYMQLEARNRSANEIDRGLTTMAASLSTPSMAAALMGNMPQERDAGAQLGNMMKMQQMQYQQAALAQLRSPQFINEMSTRTGMSPEMVLAGVNAGKAGDMITSASGMSGPPNIQDMTRAKVAWQQQNPGQTPPDYFFSPDKWAVHTQTEGDRAKEIASTQNNFDSATKAYDQQLGQVSQLLDPKNKQYINEFLGPVQSKIKPIGEMSPQAQELKGIYDQVMAGQFGSAVQDFPGSRISTKELTADAPSKSNMTLSQGYDSFIRATQRYQDTIEDHRAGIFGKAQQLNSPNLTDYDYDKRVDDIYKPGGALAGDNTPKRTSTPAVIQTTADLLKLPKGKSYIVPKGFDEAGQVRYAGY